MPTLLDDPPPLQLDAGEPPGLDAWHPSELPDEQPWLTLGDWIAAVAGVVGDKRTPAATWLAAELRQLADLARALGASTPEELDARRAILDADMDERLRDDAYHAGLACLTLDNHPLW